MARPTSSGFVNNWQEGKTVTECNLRMLQEEDCFDVTFRCGTEGHVVKAHRYMLISRSCVFHAMLTGAMAEKSDVKIPDIEPLVFKTFLTYIYTDDTDINADNVTALLYTARKYGVIALESKCTEFMDRSLTVHSACDILTAAHCFDQKKLYEKALTLIKSQGERSLQSSGFQELSQDLVDEIVGSDDLDADEHVIFNAVNEWSEAECVRKGKAVNPDSKRSVLGGILMKVRFPLMEPAFLADNVKKRRLLTDAERTSCLDFTVSPKVGSTPFNHEHRMTTVSSKCFSPSRFHSLCDSWIMEGDINAISFLASSDLYLLGCQLFGSYTGNDTYYITAYCGDVENVLSCVIQERSEYTSEGVMFDMIFSCPVSIKAGEWYTLVVQMEGPGTWAGVDGEEKVVCDDGVELQFRDSYQCNSETNIWCGQIPKLIYKKC